MPYSDDSMSWVASALPAKSTSTKPALTIATIAGAAPVCTTPGPPTHSTFLPSALASRIPSATWRTRTACGFSDETSDSMKPKASLPLSTTGAETRMPEAPVTTCMPTFTSDIGRVKIRPSSTTRPQSISGFSTSYQRPSSRTRVGRLVVE